MRSYVGVLAVALIACKQESAAPAASPTGTSAAAGAGGDMCAKLTAAQIEAAAGTPVVKTVPYGHIECRWTVKPLPDFPGAQDPWLDVQLSNDAQMRAVEEAPGTGGVVAIEGLGDRAFRTNDHHHLWVKHGSQVFVVRSRLTALGDKSETTREKADAVEVRLARLVLGRP